MQLSVFWHRRDLRLDDNAGLYHALRNEHPVLPLFIFDTNILEKLEDKDDARLAFIHDQILKIQTQLKELGTSMIIRHGNPLEVWQSLTKEFEIAQVYTNRIVRLF